MRGGLSLENRAWRVVADTALITPSGALSPGPLSASAVAAGLGLGVLGGVLVAVGHLVVELPYFVALLLFLPRVERALGRWRRLLDVIAGGFMWFFALLLVGAGLEVMRGGRLGGVGEAIRSPLLALTAGVALTGANAYFLAWWVTVGKPIVDGARGLGWGGRALVYAVHYSFDLGWLALLAWLGGLGGGLLMGGLLLALAVVLAYYGARMVHGVLHG